MAEKVLDSSLDSGQNNSIEEPIKDDASNVGDYQQQIYALESKYTAVKSKYKEAKQEINQLKRKRETEPVASNTDERVKQLEERVMLIKTKAKEKIAEKDDIIAEQNEKLAKFEEMLGLLEVNCKQAVVKYNEAQVELAKKEETLQQHLSFRNRYDYKVNFLDEKCRKIKNEYDVKLKKMEERLNENTDSPKQEIKEELKLKISKVAETKVDKVIGQKKPSTLRIEKVDTEQKQPKLKNGLTIKEVKDESNSSKEKTKELSDKIEESEKEEPKKMLANLPGVKITLTEAIDELDQIVDTEEQGAKSLSGRFVVESTKKYTIQESK